MSAHGDSSAFEKHYRIGELARIWAIGRETVRKLVMEDPGVIKIRMGRKKANTTYSVPERRRRENPQKTSQRLVIFPVMRQD